MKDEDDRKLRLLLRIAEWWSYFLIGTLLLYSLGFRKIWNWWVMDGIALKEDRGLGVLLFILVISYLLANDFWQLKFKGLSFLERLWLFIEERFSLFVILSLPIGYLFWKFKVAKSYGDANDWVFFIDKAFYTSEPLSTFIHYLSYKILAKLGFDAGSTVAFTSVVCGMGFFIAMVFLVSGIIKKGLRLLSLGLILSGGYIILFFGYQETTSKLFFPLILYFLTSFFCFEGKLGIWLPSFLLAISTLAHGSASFLLPGLFYLWIRSSYGKKDSKPIFIPILTGIAYFFLPLIIFTLIIYFSPQQIIKHPIGNILGGGDRSMFVPLSSKAIDTKHERYTMFSSEHLADIFNELLTLSPFFPLLPLILLIGGKKIFNPYRIFMLITGGCFLFLLLTWNADWGMFKDWDLFASSPLTVNLLLILFLNHLQSQTEGIKQRILLLMMAVNGGISFLFYRIFI